MTDERLDQILKQALAPEIADTEIAVKQAGRNYYMKKLWKIGVAAVACAALLVAGTIAAGHQTVQKKPGAVSISKNPFATDTVALFQDRLQIRCRLLSH